MKYILVVLQNSRWKNLFLCLILGGCLDTDEINFIPFSADFQAPNLARVNQSIQFSPDESTTGAQEYLWEFGDPSGQTSRDATPTFSYDSIGVYLVTLKVKIQKTQGIVEDSISKLIRILPETQNETALFELGDLDQNETLDDIQPLPNGEGYIMLGKKNINTLLLTRLNNDLSIVWEREFNNLSQNQIFPRCIRPSIEGGFLISGGLQSAANDQDAFILKVDANGSFGNQGWFRQISSINDEVYSSVEQVVTNGDTIQLALGYARRPDRPTLIIDQYDQMGNLIRSQNFIDECGSCLANHSLIQNEGDRFQVILAGQFVENPALFRFDLVGNEFQLAARSLIPGIRGESARPYLGRDGKFIAIGKTQTFRRDSSNAFIAKLDAILDQGISTWQQTLTVYKDDFKDVIEDADGNLLAIGIHQNPLSSQDIILAKFNPNSGRLLDVTLLGDRENNQGLRIIPQNNSFLLAGSTENNQLLGLKNSYLIEFPADF